MQHPTPCLRSQLKLTNKTIDLVLICLYEYFTYFVLHFHLLVKEIVICNDTRFDRVEIVVCFIVLECRKTVQMKRGTET